ncbi:MAG: DUF2080 family transposase-associated protein [Candidatus Woesearchaeota archaeon]
MQIEKIVQKGGNSGHIYLPKDTVGKKVAVILIEKSLEDIKNEVIDILKPYLNDIKGVYIVGSYARNEQKPDSDIDILVVANSKIKIQDKISQYEIISASIEQIKNTLRNNAVLLLPMIKEAVPIINEDLIEKYKYYRLNKENTKWYIETTETSLGLAKDWMMEEDKYSLPNIVYPLITRLKGLLLVQALMNNKKPANAELFHLIERKGISNKIVKQLYKMYQEKRDNKEISPNNISYKDIHLLLDLVEKTLKRVKKSLARQK